MNQNYNQNYQEEIQHIRQMMDRSSRFLSLSGTAGVLAGLFALLSTAFLYFVMQKNDLEYAVLSEKSAGENKEMVAIFIYTALFVLFTSLISGYLLTHKNSKKKGISLWSPSTKNFLSTFIYPLATGGILALVFLYQHLFYFLAPTTLLFYGLGLLSASKYSYTELRYLGFCMVALGLMGFVFLDYGLYAWALGFGILHIIYGAIMSKKNGQ